MFSSRRRSGILFILFFLITALPAIAQPTLPDMIGSNEKGLVLLSWTCQYDGVKSISVLRSSDSTFNYSTVGYVKKLYKGVQGFIDGHPYPGKNYYKLAIVFNSGLTWTCNHLGVFVDTFSVSTRGMLPSNEALQKLLVTENLDKAPKTESAKTKPAHAPADRDKYMEVLHKDTTSAAASQEKQKIKLNNENEEPGINSYMDALPEAKRPKIVVSYDDDINNVAEDLVKEGAAMPAPEQKKKISLTFDDKDDVNSFIDALPKTQDRKITISYNDDTADLENAPTFGKENKPVQTAPEKRKKISMTFKDEGEVREYVESLPKASKSKITVSYNVDSAELKSMKYAPAPPKVEPPRTKISIKFSDEVNMNASSEIKSKYISMDNITGHVTMKLPADIATHHYSIKFFDKDNHMVIDVPKINAVVIILDKRNFQKKGQYKFTIRKDALELESGNITIY